MCIEEAVLKDRVGDMETIVAMLGVVVTDAALVGNDELERKAKRAKDYVMSLRTVLIMQSWMPWNFGVGQMRDDRFHYQDDPHAYGMRNAPRPAYQPQPNNQRHASAHHDSNDLFAVSRGKLQRWNEEMENLDALRIAVKHVAVSGSERATMRAFTEHMKSVTTFLQAEMMNKLEGQRLREWKW
ncbi:hypothetical protein EJ02DRAFT_422298 [Clathrospora elynae]|uniref:Uncharacterized protein n=1 Tax=Clathrospora elynae TaxID=706981 RepID=A0A6A5SUG3_9PLEO|nr:hypothetical protein EJ02DRAFT_422298 [Clathrospora elynae]